MPAQYPGIGYPPDSQVNLLRKLVNNTALIVAAGGGGGAGLPAQAGNAGRFLTTDGATASWGITVTAPNSFNSDTNNGGNSTVLATAQNHTEHLLFIGAARSSIIILDANNISAGDIIVLHLTLPATPNIVISVRTGSVAGALLLPVESYPTQNFTTDGNILSAYWRFVAGNSGEWLYDTSNIPA